MAVEYVLRDGVWVDRDTGIPMLFAPMVVSDIKPYRSPVTGEVISGRRAKKEDLARHNCVDTNELTDNKPFLGGRLRSRDFAIRRNLTHLLKEDSE